MDYLTSLNLDRVEVGQLLIPVGTIGPVYVKVGDGRYIPGDQLRRMAKDENISSTRFRRFFIERTNFDKTLSRDDLGHQAYFSLTDDEVHMLYVDCQKLRGNVHANTLDGVGARH